MSCTHLTLADDGRLTPSRQELFSENTTVNMYCRKQQATLPGQIQQIRWTPNWLILR